MKIDRELLKKVAIITLEREEEDSAYTDGHFQREDGSNDDELCNWIRDELNRGNYWAWCTAHVTVEYHGMKAEEWLGGCSYKSREDFMQPGCYFDSMVDEALGTLATELEAIANAHIWEHDAVTCFKCVVAA
jgi:hypothetical protein